MKSIFSLKNKKSFASFIVLAVLIFATSRGELLASVMQSTSYGIQSDSINFGGTNVSGSTSYSVGDTLGENATGDSLSANYGMHAGFWQMQSSSIAISSPSDLALSSISGTLGGSSEGTVAWTVTTDNIAGYSMTINASTSPALKSASDSFADYTPAGSNPDYNFTVASNASAFGFSPEGADTDPRFLDNGSACNTGASETLAHCWDGLSITPKTIVTRNTSNQPSGTVDTVRFHAESGASHIQTTGAYSATITVTAVTL